MFYKMTDAEILTIASISNQLAYWRDPVPRSHHGDVTLVIFLPINC